MNPAHNIARRGFLAGTAAVAGTGLMAADHQTASPQPHTQHKTTDTDPGKPPEQTSTLATPTDIRRTA
ncbi:twin-arginine translocation signal domain-containing protein [Streptomyces sp. NPDC001401]|uniref:twin-arginine translocation signal domain-containing protein n=1 Tax=Streptomyces sp. NPDC001401 TaxID=3364570 RepID=UPI00367F0E48